MQINRWNAMMCAQFIDLYQYHVCIDMVHMTLKFIRQVKKQRKFIIDFVKLIIKKTLQWHFEAKFHNFLRSIIDLFFNLFGHAVSCTDNIYLNNLKTFDYWSFNQISTWDFNYPGNIKPFFLHGNKLLSKFEEVSHNVLVSSEWVLSWQLWWI